MKMKKQLVKSVNRPPVLRAAPQQDSGVALITALLILSIMSLLGLAMTLSVNSDMMINGYYRNFRGSFYAADSGLNTARQALLSQIEGQIPSTFSTPPMPSTTSSTAVNTVLTSYGSSYTSLNAGQAAGSWGESFEVSAASLSPSACTVTATSNPNPPAPPPAPACSTDPQATAYQYIYTYSLTSLGKASGSEQETVSESGSVILNVSAGSSSTKVSFASFGAFVDQYPPCLGPLIPGTMTGMMFTNGAWQFTTGGKYIFTDPVGQENADADYWFGGTCITSPTSSYKRGKQLINPTFQDGLQLNQPAAQLPQNAFSQEWAALDGKGQGEADASPTNADKNALLKDISGTAYPTAGAASGVYLNYNGSDQVEGGGIYIEGDAQVALAPSGTSAQVYTVTQGSTTTTITVDPSANSGQGATTVVSGTTTLNLIGVPKNLSITPVSPAMMLYVNGNISGLTGPGQGQAAIQNNAAVD
ncbi:MAG: hypothetical protein ACRD10_06585, partial [Terriglobia bacterium]